MSAVVPLRGDKIGKDQLLALYMASGKLKGAKALAIVTYTETETGRFEVDVDWSDMTPAELLVLGTALVETAKQRLFP